MRTYLRTADGTFDGTYAEYYTIDRSLRVWSVRSRKYLLPDMKGRVFLSVGGRKVRVPVKRLWQESLLRGGRQVTNFTNECTREVKMGGHQWRIGADATLSTACYYYFLRPQDRVDNPAVEEAFMSLLTMRHLKKYPPGKPTFTQLLAWCGKYADGLLSLQGAYGLYRDLGLFCPQEESMLVIKKDAANKLVLYADGAACVMQDGKMVFRGILLKGSKETWQAEKEIRLSEIGRPEALGLNVNGKDITLSGRRIGKSILITHKGINLDPKGKN